MSREYNENSMLKSKGIVYFPPVNNFEEAMLIYKECGGMIISLEEDGYLVEEPIKISRLYNIPLEHLELYFKDVLKSNNIDEKEIEILLKEWRKEELSDLNL